MKDSLYTDVTYWYFLFTRLVVARFTFLAYHRIQLENLFEIFDRQAHDNKPYSSVLLQDESADSSLVMLGAILRGKTVLVLTQNDGLFVWYV